MINSRNIIHSRDTNRWEFNLDTRVAWRGCILGGWRDDFNFVDNLWCIPTYRKCIQFCLYPIYNGWIYDIRRTMNNIIYISRIYFKPFSQTVSVKPRFEKTSSQLVRMIVKETKDSALPVQNRYPMFSVSRFFGTFLPLIVRIFILIVPRFEFLRNRRLRCKTLMYSVCSKRSSCEFRLSKKKRKEEIRV